MFKNICFNCGEVVETPYPLCANCKPVVIKKECSCLVCGIETSKFVKTCPSCMEVNRNYQSNYSLFSYSGMAKEILQQFKFKKNLNYSIFYAELIMIYIKKNFKKGVVLCPVPTSFIKRKLKNGYQLDSIVKELKKNSVDVEYLLRKKYSKTQKKLNKFDRSNNLSDSFVLKKTCKKNKPILLFDDVFTTGATINECARVLKAKYSLIHSITLYRD